MTFFVKCFVVMKSPLTLFILINVVRPLKVANISEVKTSHYISFILLFSCKHPPHFPNSLVGNNCIFCSHAEVRRPTLSHTVSQSHFHSVVKIILLFFTLSSPSQSSVIIKPFLRLNSSIALRRDAISLFFVFSSLISQQT